MTANPAIPRFVPPADAVAYDLLGEKVFAFVSGQNTDGRLALFFGETPPGAGGPAHIHRNEDETFYVLEGELAIQGGDERFTVPAGSAAFLPRGVPHAYANLGEQTAKWVMVVTPAGLEEFFAEVEPLVTQAEPDMAAVLPIAAKYNIEFVGPPLTAGAAP